MPDFPGGVFPDQVIDARWTTRQSELYETPHGNPKVPVALDTDFPEAGAITITPPAAAPPNVAVFGEVVEASGLGEDWFEMMHVLPRTYLLGNVLATITVPTEVHNAYRKATRSWTGFTNNAGAGVTLLGLPGLPVNILPQASISSLNLEVTTNGPPLVDTTEDFAFDSNTLLIPIEFRRVVLFAIAPPELPMRELLSFLTSVLPKLDGTEQRISPRENPRQILGFEIILEEGEERILADNFLFERQGQSFGVPIWQELTPLTQDESAAAGVINVQDTTFADFREGGFLLIFQDRNTVDVLQVATGGLTATTITLVNPTVNAYKKGTAVMPLRLCDSPEVVTVRRFPRGASRLRIDFRTIDNDISIASAAAFGSYAGKVLLDDFNWVQGSMPEALSRRLVVLDNETGLVSQQAVYDRGKHRLNKTFLAVGRQGVWELRQLLHFLRGRQTSFYLPSHHDDFVVQNPLVISANTIDVNNTGYFQFVQDRQPRNVIRVTFNTGDPPLLREITSSTEVSAAVEQFTLDDVWPAGHPVADIARVELVEKVRFDTDDLEIVYHPGERTARLEAPVKTVFD